MLEVIHNDDGDIIAVCEWLLFNKDGRLDDNGSFIFVAEVEINKTYRNNGVLRKFIKRIGVKCPHAKKVFFYRENKYPGRKPKIYDIKQFKGG